MKTLYVILGLLLIAPKAGAATRIKEIASVEGVRDNQLIGYGLVVGLAGTGDRRQTVFSAQSLSNMLERMGISVPATSLRVANMAAVIVTATLPPFAQSGTRIDVTAASAGDASNLQGGLLLLTPLKGPDGTKTRRSPKRLHRADVAPSAVDPGELVGRALRGAATGGAMCLHRPW